MPQLARMARWRGRRAWTAAALALAYLATGVVWIVYSDQLAQELMGSPDDLTRFQTWKGIGFVAITALFLFAALAWPVARWHLGRADTAGPARAGRTVPGLLALLVLATALPLVALLLWTVQRETQAQLDAAERLVRALSRTTAEQAALFLDMRRRVAASLADRPGVRALAPDACDPLLEQLPELDTAMLDVASFDAQGRRVCGGTPHAVRDPRWRERLARGGFVDDLGRAPGGGWSFSLVQPIFDPQGALAGAVEVTFSAGILGPVVSAPVGGGGAVAVFDASQVVVARYPDAPGSTGLRIADPRVAGQLRAADGSTYVGTGVDGVRRLYAAHPVADTGWVASAGVPLEQLYAPARAAFARSAIVGLAVLAFCSLLVVRLSAALTRPLRALERTAARAAAGDFSLRAPEGGPLELARLGAGMNEMLDRLPRLQRELAESEARSREQLEKLSRNLPAMIFILELPGARAELRMPYASEAIRTLLELEPEQVVANAAPALDRIHWLDRERVELAMAAAAREKVEFHAEFRVELPRGGVRHVLARAQPEQRRGPATLWFGALTDITELHASRQALAQLNETLEHRIAERTAALGQANEALEAFSYSVAHDLRAPLASIGGFAQVVEAALQDGNTDRAQQLARRISANAERMNAMIASFLALARVGRAPLLEGAIDMDRLVREVAAELARPRAARLDIDPLPRVLADGATLRQAWHNLLSNAFKYSGRQPQPQVRVGWRTGPDGEAVFFVEDNGVGFDPAYADRLFTPFSRLHKETEFEGTGVGLSLVRRIVERHGGTTWATLREGGGAIFLFSLPPERLLAAEARDGGAAGEGG